MKCQSALTELGLTGEHIDVLDVVTQTAALWRTAQQAPLASEAREILSQVLEFGLPSHFADSPRVCLLMAAGQWDACQQCCAVRP